MSGFGCLPFSSLRWGERPVRPVPAGECPKGLKPVTEFRIFFGLTDAAGEIVTEDEWQRFLADTITPRFRAGLTVLDGPGTVASSVGHPAAGAGQGRDRRGRVRREPEHETC